MRRRTLKLLVMITASGAIFAAPASAQSERTIPVVGGGSFGKAAPVSPNERYTDSVRPGETVFYRVELDVGQVLKVNFDTAKDITMKFPNGASLEGRVYDPFRYWDPGLIDWKSNVNESVETDPVAPTGLAGMVGESDASGPGTWYISVEGLSISGARDRYTLPFTFEPEVKNEDGTEATPVAAATPTPRSSPAGTATAAPPRDRQTERNDSEGNDSPPVGVLGGVIGGGLLLGGIAGVGIRRRRP